MVFRSQKPRLLKGRRVLIRGMISMTRETFSATIVRSLATSLLIVDQTRKESQKKKT